MTNEEIKEKLLILHESLSQALKTVNFLLCETKEQNQKIYQLEKQARETEKAWKRFMRGNKKDVIRC